MNEREKRLKSFVQGGLEDAKNALNLSTAVVPVPKRCAECDCGNPPHDCSGIKPGPYADPTCPL